MRVFITGTAGFIGYHLAERLLAEGHQVTGYDGITPYYDIALKRARHGRLARHPGFRAIEAQLEDRAALAAALAMARPEALVHLAAQAGVRWSIENPRAVLETNVLGSLSVMEAAQAAGVRHLLIASTSSVYGANAEMPHAENHRADLPMSFYAASKKATEAMAHSWSHIHGLPITLFRFFTVYGPWGRPDMALFKFTQAILEGVPIPVYNHGQMWRDFTYVDDLVAGICALIPRPPGGAESAVAGDSLSPVAPCRVVNIGNSTKIALEDFITAIEAATGRQALRDYQPMQPGDVAATWADAGLLQRLTGHRPATPLAEGVARFVEWYRAYHQI